MFLLIDISNYTRGNGYSGLWVQEEFMSIASDGDPGKEYMDEGSPEMKMTLSM